MVKHRYRKVVQIVNTDKNDRRKFKIFLVFAIVTAFFFPYLRSAFWGWLNDQECLIDMPREGSKIFREIVNCDICSDIQNIPKIAKVPPEDFEALYVDRTKPVVVTDATRTWTAIHQFTFDYFKEVYGSHPTADDGCQFFPYRTEFRSLTEALNMSRSRADLTPGELPWYIGWSNCHDNAGRELRRHYERPYFLPPTSENIALSWIFMGGPGFGAHIHVDNVRYPSWQAQLRGRKRWRLVPPPECAFSCREVDVIVEPGEIIRINYQDLRRLTKGLKWWFAVITSAFTKSYSNAQTAEGSRLRHRSTTDSSSSDSGVREASHRRYN